MKAVTWHGKRDVRVDTVPDPTIEEPTDAIIRVTSTGICGSDLHLYEVLGAVHERGRHPRPRADGHRRGGRRRGRRTSPPATASSIPFNISCGHCCMCDQGLYTQCETTQVREQGKGAALFGYTKLYGQVPGGQAEFLRVPQAQYGPIKVPEGPPDDRFLFLSDVLPTAWQAVEYADVPGRRQRSPCSGSGRSATWPRRIAQHRGVAQVIGVDLVPERLERARAHGVEVLDLDDADDTSPTRSAS